MEKLIHLRELLKDPQYNLEAYIIFTEDAHQSEYISDCDKRRAYISGFTGSSGTAVVTLTEAALWTDGRYYLQASKQLDSRYWKLMKQGLPETPSITEWLIQFLSSNSRVGIDPRLISKGEAKSIQTSLESKGHQLVPIMTNLVDLIWKDRPSSPSNKVFIHPLHYSGRDHNEKIIFIREKLKKEGVFGLVISALDEIAWLFNIRGSDIQFNPVVISYAIVTLESVRLYIDQRKLTDEIIQHLKNIQIFPYESIFDDLRSLSEKKMKLWLDPIKTSLAIFNAVESTNYIEKFGPITLEKALKNDIEIQGMRECHLRDAAALITFFSWLEERLIIGDMKLTEVSVAEKLDSLRGEQRDFVCPSFETISGYGPNGAIIHYKPELETCAELGKDNLYLCDSGGQYKDGTTDVTRTLHFGNPTEYQKKCFTRVLKGVIALDTVVFPKGTTGNMLDPIARIPLWEAGLDYRHGTGHGVGSFLNVHEGPQNISFRDSAYKQPMELGMTITDEPGYYEDGSFGIRIENVLVTKLVKTEHNFGGINYFGFEHITLVPIQTKLIDISLMSSNEIKWVNSYHQECLSKVGPLLSEKALAYLQKETAPIYE
jgi:Xaa-Pro aminopeptidase